MEEKEFRALGIGDVVHHETDSEGYVVCANYGKSGVIVTKTILISNSAEWDLFLKANHTRRVQEDSYVGREEDYNPETKVYERYHHLVADTKG
jgi:hypothetical protein